jgi:hypothetical protein
MAYQLIKVIDIRFFTQLGLMGPFGDPVSIRNLTNRHISQLTLLQIGIEVIAMSDYQCTAL